MACGACDKYPVCLWKWVEDPDYIRTRARLCKLCTQCVSGSIDFSTNSVIGEKPIYRVLELRLVSAHLFGSVSMQSSMKSSMQSNDSKPIYNFLLYRNVGRPEMYCMYMGKFSPVSSTYSSIFFLSTFLLSFFFIIIFLLSIFLL